MAGKADTKKITAHLPAALLERVQAATGRGPTESLTIALQEYDRREQQRKLAALRGKVGFDLDLEATR